MATSLPVALLLVSHSQDLAEATEALLRQVTGDSVPIVLAAGAGDDGRELGTDATHIAAALATLVPRPVLILMDLGSALLSAQMALEFLPPEQQENVALCSAPFVEGAMAGALAAQAGAELAVVAQEAENALAAKQRALPGATSPAGSGLPTPAPAALHKRCYSLKDPAGLHLRPAADLVLLAGDAGVDLWIGRANAEPNLAPARSLSALLALELRRGETLCVYSQEPLAPSVAARLDALFGGPAEDAQETHARGVVPGIAVGQVFAAQNGLRDFLPKAEPADAHGAARIRQAISVVSGEEQGNDILAAQRALLADPRLLQLIDAELAKGEGPAHAWVAAVEALVQEIESLHQPLLRARAADWRDLGRRVLQELLGVREAETATDTPHLLLVDDLLPSQAANLDPAQVLGVLDRRGAANSHAAILLRAAGIPYVINARDSALRSGVWAAMDGATGEILIAPQEEQIQALRARHAQGEPLALPADFSGTLRVDDATQIEFWANVGSLAEAREAQRLRAFGIGLLRTEFLYLDRWQMPSEEEQIRQLQQILLAMTGRQSVIRLLDAGADKALPFLDLPAEQNPALGLRGIRALLARPDFLRMQLTAILRAGYRQAIAIMLPMVSNPQEVVEIRSLLASVHGELQAQGHEHAWPVPVGIMAEVPAMLLEASSFRGITDFVSVGTNDLTQYVLAADRGDDRLRSLVDAGEHAVLSLIARLLAELDAPVSVCGEAAGDPRLALMLVRLGIRRLSMSPHRFAGVLQALHAEERR
ncbi:dihydroxyacetone kinase phosphoryl donor subunit DhaM [Acidithiobacillus sp. AMEEHan]|uniref:dihydroxyacetone kinase phosphoryl donor subunit DhaM n=1 Tax=Acidithiobacillus sp. AMEEHan TaxID=2994951 RepID=UPI0027E5B3BF|nr:dihydroxyacetone kinase phosphoryl donor subunit DhaM [Acidithiobacillus sp. AMEEHan]